MKKLFPNEATRLENETKCLKKNEKENDCLKKDNDFLKKENERLEERNNFLSKEFFNYEVKYSIYLQKIVEVAQEKMSALRQCINDVEENLNCIDSCGRTFEYATVKDFEVAEEIIKKADSEISRLTVEVGNLRDYLKEREGIV